MRRTLEEWILILPAPVWFSNLHNSRPACQTFGTALQKVPYRGNTSAHSPARQAGVTVNPSVLGRKMSPHSGRGNSSSERECAHSESLSVRRGLE
ncbi:hypothetical protein AAFF_G00061240 [Aldrovandia affinis]|uniref:Uncharacterized protein n=1 Tax=Aldrovandia affinis TaxID=143900 RepID=A0AAD7WDV7_9TELE|nr:hypothetical protein AAFF_G00061240 [Aldrovandia affinis]